MNPVRIQLSRSRGWRMPPNTISVARPGPWGNPWRVGRDGDAGHCVNEYRRLLTGVEVESWPVDDADKARALHMGTSDLARAALRGMNLACWCEPGAPCHADVLLEIANG